MEGKEVKGRSPLHLGEEGLKHVLLQSWEKDFANFILYEY
jgi:hypothetical protein